MSKPTFTPGVILYKLASGPAGGVVRLADGAFIPADGRNGDWNDYLDWLRAGGTAAIADVVDPGASPGKALADLVNLLLAKKGINLIELTPNLQKLLAQAANL